MSAPSASQGLPYEPEPAGDSALILADDDVEPVRPRLMVALVAALPMFGQTFYYMKDLLPMWSLSKAFPVLSLPLALVLLRQPTAPMTRQVMLSFLWLLVVPAFNGIFYFSQDFFTGLSAEVKLLPILYFFSFLGLLTLLRPSLREVMMGFLICGTATFVSLILLGLLVPADWYTGTYGPGASVLFTHDSRGDRIRMPMYFGIVTIFYCFRLFLRSHRLPALLYALIGVALVLGLVKSRAILLGIVGVLSMRAILATRGWRRLGMLALVPAALTVLLSTGYMSSLLNTDAASGFDVRRMTAFKAAGFLGVDPIRWIFGVGTISPTSSDSLGAFFDHFFFLGDITWLGIVFEFGVIGALIFLVYELRGIAFYIRRLKPRIQSIFLGSLADYLLFVLLVSNLYPPSLSTGETAVILAVFAYVHLWLESQDTLEEAR